MCEWVCVVGGRQDPAPIHTTIYTGAISRTSGWKNKVGDGDLAADTGAGPNATHSIPVRSNTPSPVTPPPLQLLKHPPPGRCDPIPLYRPSPLPIPTCVMPPSTMPVRSITSLTSRSTAGLVYAMVKGRGVLVRLARILAPSARI